nr:MAG: hypothetical protein EDM05_12385 [Leptolyngbya sp. IPPAS B-1204]
MQELNNGFYKANGITSWQQPLIALATEQQAVGQLADRNEGKGRLSRADHHSLQPKREYPEARRPDVADVKSTSICHEKGVSTEPCHHSAQFFALTAQRIATPKIWGITRPIQAMI